MPKALRIMFVNELYSMLRAPANIFFIFLFPLFFLGIMLFSYGSEGTLGPVTVEIVDQDHSGMSAEYVSRIRKLFTSSGVVSGEVVASNPAAALRQGRIRITVPTGFEQAIAGNGKTKVRLEYNAADSMVTQIATRVFEPLTLRFNADMTDNPAPVHLEYHNAGGHEPIAFAQYLVTGILVMSMMSTAVISTAFIVALRREENTFKLMSCMPMGSSSVLAAILAARGLVIFLASLLLLAVAVYVFGMPLTLTPWRIGNAAVLIAVGGGCLLSLGLAASARLASVQGAIFVGNLIYIALLLLSDLAVPLRSLAEGPMHLLALLPTAVFVSGLRGILVHGEAVTQQGFQVAVLLAWTLLFLAVARATFRWHRA